ncbi:hypothetical protein SAMN05444678_11689 [Sphingomonas sp. YR710]|uniref:hypothetical protein n=1 Tax=Sphingomonas sp. YR710 TaxID=1882773 RepID=UPI0008926042|nr:hypothetical protein [Sphingomonas sp. YR710]SDD58671.1 hypothetical protein SAMN05444678_11689 [Sphingomonas sp. YR710]
MNEGQPSILTALRPILSFTIDITSIVLLFGFVASVVINSTIFGSWGINFLLVASPQDVLMSGLFVSMWCALPTIPFVIALALAIKYRPDGKKWRPYIRLSVVTVALIAIPIIIFAAASARYRQGFIGMPLYIVDKEGERGRCGIKRVLWIGERTIVSECETKSIIVMYGAENIKFAGKSELDGIDFLPTAASATSDTTTSSCDHFGIGTIMTGKNECTVR